MRRHSRGEALRVRTLVVTPAIAPAVGGAESLAANLCGAILRSGDELDLVTGTSPYQSLQDVITEGGGQVVVLARKDPGHRLHWDHETFYRAETVFRLVEERHFDQIWVLSHDAAISTAIALAGRVERSRVSAIFSEIAMDRMAFAAARYRFAAELKCVDRFVCLSERYRSVAIESGAPPDKIVVNPLGIDMRQFARQEHVFSGAIKVIVCPSRFSERKGQLDLLRAFAAFGTAQPSATLVLAGAPSAGTTGYLGQINEQVRELGISQKVIVRTDVSNADMPGLLQASDLVVQPSYYEGLGYSAIEAMAVGTPTILTDVAGFNEFAVDGINCRLVQPRDVEGLAAAMSLLNGDVNIQREIAAGGLATASARFDIDVNYRSLRVDPVPATTEAFSPAVSDVG